MIRRPEIAGAAVDRVGNGNAPPFHSGHISVTLRATIHGGRTDDHLPPLHVPWSRIGDPLSGTIFTLNEWWRIENRSGNEGRGPARRLGKNRGGGALDSNYVVARWTHAERPEELEFRAHRGDVTPLDGWV
jgi:hypothetical protein